MEGIQRIDNIWYKSSYLIYKDDGHIKPGAKTRIFNVYNCNHKLLGHVKWWTSWRQYCFFPLDSSLYNTDCMYDLAEFCYYVTCEHKNRLPNKQRLKDLKKLKRKRRLERLAISKEALHPQETQKDVQLVEGSQTNDAPSIKVLIGE